LDAQDGAAIASASNSEANMHALIERCCALDIGEATLTACLLVGSPTEKAHEVIREFRTLTCDLLVLRDWLKAERCTHVVMESTGVYWEPIYEILEGSFELVVGNAQHIKNVPGRKTDTQDSQWLASLLRHGLIRKSFIPPKDLRQLRVLTRYRTKLTAARTGERNRLLKLLERANIKLASIMSDVFGVSGSLMVQALLAEDSTPSAMARLAKGSLRRKIPDLELALDGKFGPHHRTVLTLQLARLQKIEADITAVDTEIQRRLVPYQAAVALLQSIPGVAFHTAAVWIAEVGTDVNAFPTDAALASWAGVSPGNNESAGKRRNCHTTPGNVHLRTALVEAAHCAARAKGTYLREKFYRLRARRGSKRAAVAVARKILIAAYHMLQTNQPYKDLGDVYLDKLHTHKLTHSLLRRLKRLGLDVAVTPAAAQDR
jgi:transposase